MIEPLNDFGDNVIAFACHGHVTKADYEVVLVPAVEKALASGKRLRLYYEIAPDFVGIAPGAMWEDFKVGMQHLNRWERVAVVTDVDWIKHAVRLFAFLLPGKTRVFPTAEVPGARAWIVSAA